MSVRVMLDAGHYGLYNRSPAVPDYYESVMTWKLHLMLAAELEKYGVGVGRTSVDRSKDLAVSSRGKLARGYDMFISLHSNSVGGFVCEGTDRPVVYRLNSDSDTGELFARKTADAIREIMGTIQPGRTAVRVGKSGGEYYGVLRGAAAAGCTHAFIIEHSFHTATAPAKWLLDDGNLARLAAKEAELVAEFFGLEKPGGKEGAPMTEVEKAYVDSLEKRVAELEKQCRVYHWYSELPDYARETIERLHREGVFVGAGAHDMQLTGDMMRILLILAKRGVI